MTECKCTWDGNLDGRLLRCKTHADQIKAERKARKIADETWKRALRGEGIDHGQNEDT